MRGVSIWGEFGEEPSRWDLSIATTGGEYLMCFGRNSNRCFQLESRIRSVATTLEFPIAMP